MILHYNYSMGATIRSVRVVEDCPFNIDALADPLTDDLLLGLVVMVALPGHQQRLNWSHRFLCPGDSNDADGGERQDADDECNGGFCFAGGII